MTKLDTLFKDRSNYCVIALTGYTAVGCSRLASYMADEQFYRSGDIRHIDSINIKKEIDTDNNNIYFSGKKRSVQENLSLEILISLFLEKI